MCMYVSVCMYVCLCEYVCIPLILVCLLVLVCVCVVFQDDGSNTMLDIGYTCYFSSLLSPWGGILLLDDAIMGTFM